MMENIAKLMERTNRRYYPERGKHIYQDFKTFAASARLGRACALEFLESARETEGELRIYEFGVGDGNFAKKFLENLNRIDPSVGKRIAYTLWDISRKMLDGAEEKLEGHAVESVCAPAEEAEKMGNAFWIRGNEILDDIPARVFMKQRGKTYEVGWNNGELAIWEQPGIPAIARERMESVPEGYWVPVNIEAIKLVEKWKRKIIGGGGISIFEYGFCGEGEMEALTPEIWNSSVVRKYGEQYTVDVDFGWLEKKCGGRVEAQDDFVGRMLDQKLFAVEVEKLDYMDAAEIEAEAKKLEKEGYDIELLKRGVEKNPFYHYLFRKSD
ncbi:MAG: SAM-dependent methyltransferase [Candidatus Micrarchaeia archaeon]